MSNYGLFIQNERTSRAFDEGYAALNFVGGGITGHFRGNVYGVEFRCPTKPVIFYRSEHVNTLTVPHYVWDRGNGLYRAYTLGKAEIFVFSTAVIQRNEPYGMRIWARNGRLVYQSSDDTVKPIARALINHGANWYSGTGRKIAYALHGIARSINHNPGTQMTTFANTAIQSIPGGFGARFVQTYDGRMSPDEFRHAFHGHQFLGFKDLSPASPVSMLVIDVHDMKYVGMPDHTFY